MKKLHLLLLLAPLAACTTSPGRMVPYSQNGANALSRDDTACKNQGFDRGSDGYLDCLRKLADSDGYWLLATRGNLQFVAHPAGYRQPPTLFMKGAHLAADQGAVPAAGSQPLDMTGTWNMFQFAKFSPSSCTFRQTGNELTGFCKDALENEGPIVGSVDGQRVGWRWLHNRSIGGYAFVVELFAATVESNDKIGGGFETYDTASIFEPTFDFSWSVPPNMRFTNRFFAKKLPPTVEAERAASNT